MLCFVTITCFVMSFPSFLQGESIDPTQKENPIKYPTIKPTFELGQVVPLREPWPDSAQGYENLTSVAPLRSALDKENSTLSENPLFRNLDDIRNPLPAAFDDLVEIQPSHQYEEDVMNVLGDRFQENSPKKPSKTSISLEYIPQKPSFVGSVSGGIIEQIIPPGAPLPSEVINNSAVEDRFEDNSTILEEQFPNRPSFVSSVSSGIIGQIIPPGPPLPSEGIKNSTVEDRFQDNSSLFEGYVPNKSSFVNSFSSGIIGQIIPPGKPLPSKFEEEEPTKFQESTSKPPSFNPNRPSFGSHVSSSSHIIPPGKPLDSGNIVDNRFDGIKRSTTKKTNFTHRPPLNFNKPSLIGQILHVPSKKPILNEVPSNIPSSTQSPLEYVPSKKPILNEVPSNIPSSTRSPLEYVPNRPSFASDFSSGVLEESIPSDKNFV